MIYYNQAKQHLYMFFPRTGSSLFHILYELTPDIQSIDLARAFELLDQKPDIPIYITIRDPEIRFRGGLQTTTLNNLFVDTEVSPIHKASDFWHSITAIKEYTQSFDYAYSVHGLTSVPFHLCDVHLAHILWRPLLLLAYGYNVHIIPLGKYTEFLLRHYPEHSDHIWYHHREGADKHPNKKAPSRLLWHSYQSVFIDTNYTVEGIDWTGWIKPERAIYDYFDQESEKTPETACILIQNLINENLYFSDFSTPQNTALEQLLAMLFERHGVHTELRDHRLEAYEYWQKAMVKPNCISYPKVFSVPGRQ